MPRLLYILAVHALLPWALLHLLWRARRQPDYLRHWGERFGFYDAAVAGPVIWIHAVSVGETRAAQPLVAALKARYPDHRILLTHMTPTGRATSEALFGDTVERVYLPYDTPWAMRRFLRRFRPAVGLVMETELWPNLIAACRDAEVPLLLVNARLSEKSARRYARLPALTRGALRSLAAVAASGAEDARRLRELGAAEVAVLGNMKFDIAPPAPQLALGLEFRTRIGRRPVFLCASTREGEEALILDAWKAAEKVGADGTVDAPMPGPAFGAGSSERSEGEAQRPEPKVGVDGTVNAPMSGPAFGGGSPEHSEGEAQRPEPKVGADRTVNAPMPGPAFGGGSSERSEGEAQRPEPKVGADGTVNAPMSGPAFGAGSSERSEGEAQRPEPKVGAGGTVNAPLLVIVPRHPQRFDEVARLAAARGLALQRRSDDAPLAADTRVWLGDSMGEMFAYYAAADLAFVGGSLLPFGSQNLIEPCAVGAPVLIGPSTYNFAEAAQAALAAGAARQVADAAALVEAARTLLADLPARQAMGAAGRSFSAEHRGATARTLALIEGFIPAAR